MNLVSLVVWTKYIFRLKMEGSFKDDSLRAEIEKVDQEYKELLSEYSRLTRKHILDMDLDLSSETSLTVGNSSSVHHEYWGSESNKLDEDKENEAELSSPRLPVKDISDEQIKATLDRILQKTPVNLWREKVSTVESEVKKEADEVPESVQNNAMAEVQSTKGSTEKSFVKTCCSTVEKGKRLKGKLSVSVKCNEIDLKRSKVKTKRMLVRAHKTVKEVKVAYSRALGVSPALSFLLLPDLEELEDSTLMEQVGDCNILASGLKFLDLGKS